MVFRIAATIGLLGGLLATAAKVKSYGKGNEGVALVEAISGYRYDAGTWNWKNACFTIPTGIGCGISLVGAKTGVNRYLPKGIKL